MNTLENIRELQYASEIISTISGEFQQTEIKLFQSDVDDQAKLILFHM